MVSKSHGAHVLIRLLICTREVLDDGGDVAEQALGPFHRVHTGVGGEQGACNLHGHGLQQHSNLSERAIGGGQSTRNLRGLCLQQGSRTA